MTTTYTRAISILARFDKNSPSEQIIYQPGILETESLLPGFYNGKITALQVLAELDYSQILDFWIEDKNKNRFILSQIDWENQSTPLDLLKNVFNKDVIQISPQTKLGVTCKYPNNFIKATNDYLTIFGYAEETLSNPLEELTASEIGAEPAGAAAIALSDAKAYTDSKISQIPPPPTLVELGGEPLGSAAQALSSALAYTDQKINLENWKSFTLQNGWTNYGSPHAEAQYTIFGKRIVVIRGLIKNGSIGLTTPITSLPEGFRPQTIVITTQLSSSAHAARVDIYPNGNIVALFPTPDAPSWLTFNAVFSL